MTTIGLAEGIENGVGMEPNQTVGKTEKSLRWTKKVFHDLRESDER